MYIDASAIVAILAEASDAPDMFARIDAAITPLYVSPPTVYEAVVSLARKKADT